VHCFAPKSAVKRHTLLDLRGNIPPRFIHIPDGKLGDVKILDVLSLETGAFYVMDRGYLDFDRLYAMHRAQAFFVMRAKSNTKLRRVYLAKTDRGGVAENLHGVGRFASSQNSLTSDFLNLRTISLLRM
jgi:hypothetical protein